MCCDFVECPLLGMLTLVKTALDTVDQVARSKNAKGTVLQQLY